GLATSAGAGTTTITASLNSISDSTSLTVTTGSGVTLSPASLSFGNQGVNTTSNTQTVTLSNSTGTALQIVSILASGDFGQTNNCPASLAAGNSCAIQVSFTPSGTGTRNGWLTVNDSDASVFQTATMSGTGTVPASTVTVSPRTAAVNFTTTFTLTHQYQAAINGNSTSNVTWDVDGMN